jgi:hypothetical protein
MRGKGDESWGSEILFSPYILDSSGMNVKFISEIKPDRMFLPISTVSPCAVTFASRLPCLARPGLVHAAGSSRGTDLPESIDTMLATPWVTGKT